MSLAAVAVHDARAHDLPRPPVDVPARPRAEFGRPKVRRPISFWPLEFMRLVAVVYLLPLVILAIGLPLGLVLTGVIAGAARAWSSLW